MGSCTYKKPFYQNSICMALPYATHDTRLLIAYALKGLKKIYKPNYSYQKAGIVLQNLSKNTAIQLNLFDEMDNEKTNRLMNVIDHINQKIGKNTVYWLAEGIKPDWQMKRNYKTPHYTTSLNDLIQVFTELL